MNIIFNTVHRPKKHKAVFVATGKETPEFLSEVELVRYLRDNHAINLADYDYHSRGNEKFLITNWSKKGEQ